MLLKLRNWMLRVLAGRSPVMLNVSVQQGIIIIPSGTKRALIYGNTITP